MPLCKLFEKDIRFQHNIFICVADPFCENGTIKSSLPHSSHTSILSSTPSNPSRRCSSRMDSCFHYNRERNANTMSLKSKAS